jgi:hypothetical protein
MHEDFGNRSKSRELFRRTTTHGGATATRGDRTKLKSPFYFPLFIYLIILFIYFLFKINYLINLSLFVCIYFCYFILFIYFVSFLFLVDFTVSSRCSITGILHRHHHFTDSFNQPSNLSPKLLQPVNHTPPPHSFPAIYHLIISIHTDPFTI